MPEPTDVLTPSQAAALLRVSVSAIVTWANAGKLRSYRTLGGHRRFFRSEIEAIAAEQADPEAAAS